MSFAITPLASPLRTRLRSAILHGPGAALVAGARARGRELRPMPVETVRLGTAGGLPFDFLSTDLHSGCLPVPVMCYGNCQQGLLTLERGHDFGDRKLNHFDPATLRQDLAALDPKQRWIRQGWNSDVSFGDVPWERTATLAELLGETGRHLVVLTKVFRAPRPEALGRLAAQGTEIRVSISALDEANVLERRLRFLVAYRAAGGLAVPYLMTTVFSDPELRSRQAELVAWIGRQDFPGAEHPLRLNRENALAGLLDLERGFAHPKFTHQIWYGTLYPEALPLPPPPSLRPSYPGLGEIYGSHVDWEAASTHFDPGTPTQRALEQGSADLSHPNLWRHGTPAIRTRDAQVDLVHAPPAAAASLERVAQRLAAPHERALARLCEEVERTVSRQGWAVVQGLRLDEGGSALFALAARLGTPARYGDQPLIRSIRPVPGLPESAYYAGVGAVALHTDKSFTDRPPRLILMECVRNDRRGGGEILLANARGVYGRLPAEVQQALLEIRLEIEPPAHLGPAPALCYPLVEPLPGGLRFRLRADLLRGAMEEGRSRAFARFLDGLRAAEEQRQLAPGELLVIDNHAVLHGRTALASGLESDRLFRRLLLH